MRCLQVLVILAALVVIGCSGGRNPVTPVSDQHSVSTPGASDAIPVIGLEITKDGSFNALGLMGAYELSINPQTTTAELTSKRLSSLGESWIVSGMDYFTVAPCHDCLRIASVSMLADGNLALNFLLKHPFAPGDPSLPPTGKNRLDLDLFDVTLVVVPTGMTPTNYSIMGAKAYTGFLANNAGYTTELGGLLTDKAAMPYVLVKDDSLGTTSTFNEFAMGASANFDVIFNAAAMTSFNFDMYLTFGYGNSAKKLQRLTPTYFNPEFNRKAAWKVKVTPPQGTNPPAIGNTWQDNDATTPFNVTVEVYDWQQGVTTIANPPVLPGDIAFASNVATVRVEIPGMNSTLPSVTTPTSGAGTPSSPLLFKVPIANANLKPAGVYTGLVKVTDSRVPDGLPPTGKIDYLIHNHGGITNYTIPEFATYQTFPATVVVGCGPITGSITNPNCPITGLVSDAKVNFTVSANSANGGTPITLYECDYNYNGTTFTTDFSNATGTFNGVGPFTVPPPCASNIPYTFTVAFRAKDSCTPPNVTIFATCSVTVTSCCPTPTVTGVTTPAGANKAYPQAYTGITVTGTNFQDPAASTVIKFISPSAVEYTATNIVVNSPTQMTFNIDLTNAALGLYDVYVKNGCGSECTANDLVQVICWTEVYHTSFDSTDSDKSNWTAFSGYWACNWFTGSINSQDSSCTNYAYCGCGNNGWDYCGRSIGFTVPFCWPTSDTIQLHVTWSFAQGSPYGPSMLKILYGYTSDPDAGIDLFYTCDYAGFATRTDVFDLSSVGLTPGMTIYLWFRNEGYACGSVGGITVDEFWID